MLHLLKEIVFDIFKTKDLGNEHSQESHSPFLTYTPPPFEQCRSLILWAFLFVRHDS